MAAPKVLTSVAELRSFRKSTNTKVGMVPTMGALHAGHATLLRKIRPLCDLSIMTLFVNPLQFGPNEDLAKYPRTFEADLRIAQNENVDAVFAPEISQLYPPEYSTYVKENVLSQSMCGIFRPQFFGGVATQVLKLQNLVQPDLSLWGLKDAQQFLVISKMFKDLNLDTEALAIPTVRESDGLALSSRNTYLSPEERQKAPMIFQSLTRIKGELEKSSSLLPQSLLKEERQKLELSGFQVQYLDCRAVPNLEVAHSGIQPTKAYIVAIAAFLGQTRLIDNVVLHPEQWPEILY